MSIFKKAQTAVAHNSTFSTFGNNDLKDLQNLIHAEKLFVGINAKAATEIQRSADSLRTWSHGEGDDFEDILPKVALLYENFSKAQLRLNYFVSTMRLHLKSIRSREEAYAEMKARKRNLASKIEGVERKLARMGPENKDLAKVTSNLREMRSDMEVLRNEMVHEEAALGDFKRRTVVEALNLKSGGLMELGEKCIVIAETCRLLSEEVPVVATVPGQGRQPYRNEARTDRLLQEAIRQLDSIQFQPRQQQDSEALTRDYSSPTMPKYKEPTSNAVVAGTGVRSGSGARVHTAADPSLSADDISRGSQGWAAPGHGAQPPPEAGLPTVHEGDDTQEYPEPYREGYQETPYEYPDPNQTELQQAALQGHTDPYRAESSRTGYYPSEPAHPDAYPAEQMRAQSRTSGYGEPEMQPPTMEPYHESGYPEAIAEEDEYHAQQPEGYGGYDMGYGYPTDAIPSFPPAPSNHHQYVSLTPHSRDSPLEDTGENRAYFEGVGSTKALQAAAARTDVFPAIDHMNINHTPGMFATDESSGRSLSPSALRPLGHVSPSASSPRASDTGAYQNMASMSDRRPKSPNVPSGQRMAPGAAASRTPTMTSPAASQSTSPLMYQVAEPMHAPAHSQKYAPPPITAPNPARYASPPPARGAPPGSSPAPTAAPAFAQQPPLYTSQDAAPPYEAAAPSAPLEAASPLAPAASVAVPAEPVASSEPAAPAAGVPAPPSGAAPAVQVGAYLPYVTDSTSPS